MVTAPGGVRVPQSGADDRTLLLERARALARPLEERSGRLEGDLAVLAVTVADQACAFELGGVREVVAAAPVARLPWARPPMTGVTSVRGEMVLVVDGRQLLGVGHGQQAGDDHPLVVLEVDERVVGLRVDAVHEVTSIPATDLALPEGPVRITSDLVRAVTPTRVVLDVGAVAAVLTPAPHQEDMP